jgi:hypothetical protein
MSELDPVDPRLSDLDEVIELGAGIARLAAGAGWRVGWWGAGATLRVGRRMAEAAVRRESPAELLDGLVVEVRETVRLFLGLDQPSRTPLLALEPPREPQVVDPEVELRRMGAELLARSAEVNGSDRAHPAYARIVSELAPDEARVLRLLCAEGPQPAVDVRSAKVPLLSSELVEPGLNMLGRQAGVAEMERTPAYLNNLERLGLIWFSREPLPDPLTYQVLEAQPEVIEALRRMGRGKTVRRSIHLTPFGTDFCHTVLPVGP